MDIFRSGSVDFSNLPGCHTSETFFNFPVWISFDIAHLNDSGIRAFFLNMIFRHFVNLQKNFIIFLVFGNFPFFQEVPADKECHHRHWREAPSFLCWCIFPFALLS